MLFVTTINGLPVYLYWGRFEIDKGMLMEISATLSTLFIMLPYRTWKSGISGERAVIKNIYDNLSNEYSIFNDILLADGKRNGNIDHLVVGPTGIFVIETKNNKETVTYDGHNWTGIAKNLSNQVQVNAFRLKDHLKDCQVFSQREPYVYAVVVFSNSKLTLKVSHEENLKWSKVLRIKSQSDRSLSDYIATKPVVFAPNEIESIEQFMKKIINNYDQTLY